MTRLLFILLTCSLAIACNRDTESPNSQAKYTYSIEGWETLGSQTLVMLEANNSSSINQKIRFKVDVINTEGKVFTKDTTIDFTKAERQKEFQLLVDTEGEVKDVQVTTFE